MKRISCMAFLLLFCADPAAAESNPYMPGGGGGGNSFFDSTPADQRDQLMQDLMGGGDAPQQTQTPAQLPNGNYQELRSQQADESDALAREKADREREIEALKDAFNAQIQQMQRKLDAQQTEIDDLRYKHF